MPRALNNPEIPLFLSIDQDIEEGKRPTFIGRVATVEMSRQFESVSQAVDGKWSDTVVNQFLVGFSGWKNIVDPESKQPLEFTLENVKAILTISEIDELLLALIAANNVTKPTKPSADSNVAAVPAPL